MRHHVTSEFEFTETGILLAGTGEHEVRVLGVFATEPREAVLKEEIAGTAEAFEPYYDGTVTGDQEDPDAAPYNPQVPSAYLTQAGELEFLSRDWSGIDLDAITIPDLPTRPAARAAPPEPETET